MRKLNSNADGMVLGFVFILAIALLSFLLLGGFSSDAVEIYEKGTLI